MNWWNKFRGWLVSQCQPGQKTTSPTGSGWTPPAPVTPSPIPEMSPYMMRCPMPGGEAIVATPLDSLLLAGPAAMAAILHKATTSYESWHETLGLLAYAMKFACQSEITTVEKALEDSGFSTRPPAERTRALAEFGAYLWTRYWIAARWGTERDTCPSYIKAISAAGYEVATRRSREEAI